MTDLSLVDDYVKALCSEIKHDMSLRSQQTNPSDKDLISTIYFGGGTPSILNPTQLETILSAVDEKFSINNKAEITIEANPETIEKTKLIEYKKMGVNRISIGVQSFDNGELQYLGRIHNADKARFVCRLATELFGNVSLDIMYGLPGQKKRDVSKNIREAVSFSPDHISCYELTYEEGTPLYEESLAAFQKASCDESYFYTYVKQLLCTAGYYQYEISNYAIRGYECRHNVAYWSDESYLGFGAGAHSYNKDKNLRTLNTKDLQRYLNGDHIESNEEAKPIERIMMGLRKNKGIPKDFLDTKQSQIADKLMNKGFLRKNDKYISFTEKGMLLANQVILELM